MCRWRDRESTKQYSFKKLDPNSSPDEKYSEAVRHTQNERKTKKKENDTEIKMQERLETIIYCNIEGLIPRKKRYKTKMLEEIGNENNSALICLTESHLKNEIRDAEIKIEGYEIFRADRPNRKKGGVLIYTRNDIAKDTIKIAADSNGEVEYAIIYIQKWKILLATVYRPPRCSTANMLEVLKAIEHEVRKLGAPEPTILIIGDFNLPNIQWDDITIYGGTMEDRQQANLLFTMMENLILKQIIRVPTRENNILDILLTNDEELISDVRAEDTEISDHRLMMIDTTLLSNRITSKMLTNTEDFQSLNFFHDQIDWRVINSEVSNVDWQEEMSRQTTVEMYQHFTSKLLKICATHIPRKRQLKSYSIPRERRTLMRKRTKLNKRLLNCESRNAIKQKLERIERELRQSYEREAKTEEQRAINTIKENPKYFFKYAKRKANTRTTIGPLKYQGHLTSDPQKMSEALNHQYTSAFSTQNPDTRNHWQTATTPPAETQMSEVEINKIDIELSIREINTYSAAGPDGIPAVLLKQCVSAVSTPLQMLWRKSLDTGEIPNLLKHGIITPIYKSGPRTEARNYRPVALTSHVIKIFERIIVKQITKYLEEQSLYNIGQHGFRSGRSCVSQLLQHRMDILNTLQDGDGADVIYLDFSKAFDKVDHSTLIQKLAHIGIRGKLHKWLEHFFENRTQSVMVEGIESKKTEVRSGVAQGSVVGPLLFLVYIGDIDCNTRYCKTSQFADDTRILGVIKNQEDFKMIQDDLRTIYNWAELNNMAFNSSKFELLRYRQPKHAIANEDYTTPEGAIINQSNHLRDLGVTISDNASFDCHITNVVAKARRNMGWIFRTFQTRDAHTLITLYKALILPIVEYCCQLWSPTSIGQIRKLEGVQRTYTSRIQGLDNMDYWQRLEHLDMYSMERRRERYMIIYVWKIINEIVPNLENEDKIRTIRNIRRGRLCVIPRLKRTLRSLQTMKESSLAIRGPRLYNCLPQQLREQTGTLSTFKAELDKHLRTIPDKPAIPHYYQTSEGNSLLHQTTTTRNN